MTDKPREPEQTSFDFFDSYWFIPNEEKGFEEETSNEDRKGYLLTAAEEKALARVWLTTLRQGQRIMESMPPNLTEAEKEKYSDYALRKVTRDDAISVLSSAIEEAVDIDLIKSAAKKYANGDFWTIELETVILAKVGEENSYEYVIGLSDDRAGYKQKTITTAEHPGFDKLSVEKQRKALGIPPRYRYIRKLYTVVITMAASMLGISLDADKEHFLAIKNHPVADLLRNFTKPLVRSTDGEAEEITAGNVTLAFEGATVGEYGLVLASEEADKLVKMLNAEITASKNDEDIYHLSLDKIMKAWGLTDRDYVWGKVTAALDAMKVLRFEYNIEEEGKKRKGFKHFLYDAEVSDGRGTPRGIIFKPGDVWLEYFSHKYIEQIPMIALQLTGGAYRIACAFSAAKLQCFGKPNENRLTVKKLLELCSFPSYEEAKKNRQVKLQILKPFKRELDKVVDKGIFTGYKAFKDNGKVELSAEEFEAAMSNYNEFVKLTIEVIWSAEAEPRYPKLEAKRAKGEADRQQLPPKNTKKGKVK